MRDPAVPPTKEPRVVEYERPSPRVAVVVATFAKVLTPLKYGMLPCTAAVEVESPPNEMTGVVPPEEMIGHVPVTLETPPSPAAERQVPLMAKQPLAIFNPLP